MSIAALLTRAKRVASGAVEITDDEFPVGARVKLTIPAIDPIKGEVLLIETDGWIRWLADDGCQHWSRRSALRRL